MKKWFIGFSIALGLVFSMHNLVLALTIAEGQITWNFTTNPSSHYYGFANYNNYYGTLYVQDVDSHAEISQIHGYLDDSYSGYNTASRGNEISAQWSAMGTNTFSAKAETQRPGKWRSSANVDLHGIMSFNDLAILPAFGYDYQFSGSTDGDGGAFSFFIQMEISYYDRDNGTDIIVYSDYNPSVPDFRKNMPEILSQGPNFSISDSDTVTYGSYATEDGRPHRWNIYYDIQVYAEDTGINNTPPSSVVPEPTSLVLLGIGLLGLSTRRRR